MTQPSVAFLTSDKLFHFQIFESRDITLDSIRIDAHSSPNTDGIHIADSTNIQVTNSVIGTGDDCISIGPGCTNLTILNVACGPGHGIVGDLGKNANEKDVNEWRDPSLVKIKDIKFRNITGTSASPEAIKLVCSKAAPCEGVELNDIIFTCNGDDEQAKNMTSTCVHVYGSSNGNVKPDSCI
ncbi:Glycosyl hydrolases family 28 [Musa troglodytarum]|uniref:Glycosyl hydrolases family 28 n=1 Tax=Musa troglodytarum TaxID=320322 RepID=A0A9E7I8B0_9LILI|nr:Glycosyl hydrolases family 28 [Musa troglodytarum]